MAVAMADPVNASLIERRKREVAAFLRVSVDRDEAEAMASSGYRYLRCGGCARRQCQWCDTDPAEQVHTGSRRPSEDPRFVTATVNRLAMFPAEVYAGVPRALAALDPDDRVVLLLELGGGLSVGAVAARLKIDRSTVHRRRERGLEQIARAVWG